MKNWRPSGRAIFTLQLLDTPFIPVVMLGWAAILSVEIESVLVPGLVCALGRALSTLVYIGAVLRPADEWTRAGELGDEQLRAASEALARAPMRSGLAYGGGWAASYALATAWVWFGLTDEVPIGPEELWSASFLIVASFFGSVTLAFSVVSMVISKERAEVSLALRARGVELPAQARSLRRLLIFFLNCFVVTTAALIVATGWSNNVAFDRFQNVAELDAALRGDLGRLAAGEPLEAARIVDADELPPARASAAIDPTPSLEHRVSIDRRRGRASVAQPLADGRWLVVEGSIVSNDDAYGVKLLLFTMIIMLWAPITIVLTVRALINPLRDLEVSMRRLIEIGDIRELDWLPINTEDEIGALTRCFNDQLEVLRDLAEAARAISQGDLAIELDQRGELAAAFRGMLAQLHDMVVQIRETAVDVTSMSSEIYAAAQAQEQAAAQSSKSVEEVSARVRSLASAAERITAVADGVLDNAGQTLETSDAMVERISQLSADASGVSDLLNLIREIADRSDLLALNGSLEATRAGEAGRGFALVAGEMRRLAERVTAAVADVGARIAEIERSGADTVSATRASRELAKDTAMAASGISEVTRAQRDETEHALVAVQVMANFVVEASTTTSQTRAAAEALRQRVEELDQRTQRFKTRDVSRRSRMN